MNAGVFITFNVFLIYRWPSDWRKYRLIRAENEDHFWFCEGEITGPAYSSSFHSLVDGWTSLVLQTSKWGKVLVGISPPPLSMSVSCYRNISQDEPPPPLLQDDQREKRIVYAKLKRTVGLVLYNNFAVNFPAVSLIKKSIKHKNSN